MLVVSHFLTPYLWGAVIREAALLWRVCGGIGNTGSVKAAAAYPAAFALAAGAAAAVRIIA